MTPPALPPTKRTRRAASISTIGTDSKMMPVTMARGSARSTRLNKERLTCWSSPSARSIRSTSWSGLLSRHMQTLCKDARRVERETVNHRYDVLDETDGDDVVIARGVTAKTASELTGVSVAWIEKRVAKDGEAERHWPFTRSWTARTSSEVK